MRIAVTARLARTASTTAAVAAAWLLAAGLAAPAQAGGPTSVLLVVPGGGGIAALYYDDPEYAELARLVGADGGLAPAGDTTGGGHETGSAVTVTWLIHDVQVWRVDRIYVGAPDGPWVASQVRYDGVSANAPVSWQRPAEPKALLALIDRLGLDPTAGDGGIPLTGAQSAPEAPPAERAAAPAARQGAPAPDLGTPWLLVAVAGLAGALAASALTLPLARRAGVRRAAVVGATAYGEPGTELATAGVDDRGTDADAGWSPPEELVARR